MIGEPSRRLPEVDFGLGGTDYQGDTGSARPIGYFPFNLLSRVISSSRINLNIARRPHATVYASSSGRLFELAACGAAIVSNPSAGMERWFEPGSELVVVESADGAVSAYEELLADPGAAGAQAPAEAEHLHRRLGSERGALRLEARRSLHRLLHLDALRGCRRFRGGVRFPLNGARAAMNAHVRLLTTAMTLPCATGTPPTEIG